MLQVYWLDLDYLLVAEAALQCSASSTALIYIEQHCEDMCTQKGISLQLPELQPLAQVSTGTPPSMTGHSCMLQMQPVGVVFLSVHQSHIHFK